jgi:hypothetical protein
MLFMLEFLLSKPKKYIYSFIKDIQGKCFQA